MSLGSDRAPHRRAPPLPLSRATGCIRAAAAGVAARAVVAAPLPLRLLPRASAA